MARSIAEAIRGLCLSFPDVEQVLSHGKPGYAVRGRFFAYYTVNHHGDGRVALLVNAPTGEQAACVNAEPRHYLLPACGTARLAAVFWVGVPAQALMLRDPRYSLAPYYGPSGWIALDASKRINATELRSLALESYRHFAAKRTLARLGT
jgi:hypothetical protein